MSFKRLFSLCPSGKDWPTLGHGFPKVSKSRGLVRSRTYKLETLLILLQSSIVCKGFPRSQSPPWHPVFTVLKVSGTSTPPKQLGSVPCLASW